MIIGQNAKQLRQRINDIYVTSTSDFATQLATAKRLIEQGYSELLLLLYFLFIVPTSVMYMVLGQQLINQLIYRCN